MASRFTVRVFGMGMSLGEWKDEYSKKKKKKSERRVGEAFAGAPRRKVE